ncbi:hypothetical protein BGW39_004156 [Mortierella sp. 14UC]|nr:hypothetical protein BGW39_004156 [Mortierella sp. 14UC]
MSRHSAPSTRARNPLTPLPRSTRTISPLSTAIPTPRPNKDFVLREDIQQAFDEALLVRYKTNMLPFMKGTYYRPLESRRIAAVLGVVLDVVVGGQFTSTEIVVLQRTIHPRWNQKIFCGAQNMVLRASQLKTIAIKYFSKDEYGGQDVGQSKEENNPWHSQDGNSTPIPSIRGPQTMEQERQEDDNRSVSSSGQTRRHRGSAASKKPQCPQDHAATAVAAKFKVIQTMAHANHGEANAQFALGDIFKEAKGFVKTVEHP